MRSPEMYNSEAAAAMKVVKMVSKINPEGNGWLNRAYNQVPPRNGITAAIASVYSGDHTRPVNKAPQAKTVPPTK